MHDARRTTNDDGQRLVKIAHPKHFVLRWAKKTSAHALEGASGVASFITADKVKYLTFLLITGYN